MKWRYLTGQCACNFTFDLKTDVNSNRILHLMVQEPHYFWCVEEYSLKMRQQISHDYTTDFCTHISIPVTSLVPMLQVFFILKDLKNEWKETEDIRKISGKFKNTIQKQNNKIWAVPRYRREDRISIYCMSCWKDCWSTDKSILKTKHFNGETTYFDSGVLKILVLSFYFW